MARGKRKVPDINSSSTADIAFLLLIFFLITTSMDTDRGLGRRWPPAPEEDQLFYFFQAEDGIRVHIR